MEEYSVFNDYLNYIEENKAIIEHLENRQSLLTDFISPIIKTLSYINVLNECDELNSEYLEIFQYGFEYLFENLEQIKLYKKQLNDDINLLEQRSIYIKMIFVFEEYKMELLKIDGENMHPDLKPDLRKIDEVLHLFEDFLTPNSLIDEQVLDGVLRFYYELQYKYDEIVLLMDAFNEYCATYGL